MSNNKGTKKRCHICKYRMRGSNHENGQHHKRAVEKLRQAGGART